MHDGLQGQAQRNTPLQAMYDICCALCVLLLLMPLLLLFKDPLPPNK